MSGVISEFLSTNVGIVGTGTYQPSVVEPKLFGSDPDPTFQIISDPAPDPDPITDPT